MIGLQKTNYSNMCSAIFIRPNKGLNIANNKWFIAYGLIDCGHDKNLNVETRLILNEFIYFLKDRHLKMLSFAVAFDSNTNKYIYSYVVSSKHHSNPDFRVDGYSDVIANVPHVFFPQLFSGWFKKIIENAPLADLIAVSEGF